MAKFEKGKSGNPTGRPKKDLKFEAALKRLEPLAIKTIEDVMLNAKDAGDRFRAANTIIEHLHGKPQQKVELNGKDGGPLVAVIREG